MGETKGSMGSPHSTRDDSALIRQALGTTEAFAAWPAALLDGLLRVAWLRTCARGELVYSEAVDEPVVLLVVSGHLLMSRLAAEGPGVPMSIMGPGTLIGVPRALDAKGEARCIYRAHGNAVVAYLPAREMLDVLDAAPSLWKSLTLMLLRQHRQMLTAMIDQLGGSLRRRLAATIARLAQVYGVDGAAMTLRLRLSQEDMAGLLQVSRGAINREMRAIEELGLLRADYGTVTVRDLPALLALGGIGSRPAPFEPENPPGHAPADVALIRQGLALVKRFAAWPPAAIEALLPSARLGRYRRGARVRIQRSDGEPEALVVLSGHLLASRVHADGSYTPVFVFRPGRVANMYKVLDSQHHLHDMYEALDELVVVHLAGRAIVERLDAQPALWRAMAPPVLLGVRAVARTLMDYQTGSTRQRLAATIARLAQLYGAGDGSPSLRLALSQDDLATMLQVSRQSINREMRVLEKQGLVGGEYGAVSVHQLAALRQLGGQVQEGREGQDGQDAQP
ncbi:cAMP-binding domain of CRP or a regulatory subunit of cAMP-dependent protein kinases [Variovorax sp. 770b2]|nr:cAMP-binding domain of CRP or a regulatory subunit of cAMP-dependent protein kinases [Variovorax sp. 770b2]